jgi:hypothetical protein
MGIDHDTIKRMKWRREEKRAPEEQCTFFGGLFFSWLDNLIWFCFNAEKDGEQINITNLKPIFKEQEAIVYVDQEE